MLGGQAMFERGWKKEEEWSEHFLVYCSRYYYASSGRSTNFFSGETARNSVC